MRGRGHRRADPQGMDHDSYDQAFEDAVRRAGVIWAEALAADTRPSPAGTRRPPVQPARRPRAAPAREVRSGR